jgi:hypothetical protein
MLTSLISTSITVNVANTNINCDANPNANVTWQVHAQTFTEYYCGGAYTFSLTGCRRLCRFRCWCQELEGCGIRWVG